MIIGGADLTAIDYAVNTPLHIAVTNNDQRNVRNLTAIITAIECPDATVRCALKIPQPPDIINYAGQTCLHIAVQHGFFSIAERLIQEPFNASINIGDRLSGKTALHYAAERGFLEFVKYLCSFPHAEVFRRTYAGDTAIDLSIGRGHYEMSAYLGHLGLIARREEAAGGE